MADDWEKRREALIVGDAYRVLQTIESVPDGSSFIVGEAVTLRAVQYSPYDSAHVYVFEASDGDPKSFWLHDDKPLTILRETFALGHTVI
jgi:hypothetical protein